MKTLVLLLLLQTTLGWAQNSKEISPNQIDLEFQEGSAPIRYYESGLPVEISLEEAFGASKLNSENSAEVNRIIEGVRKNVLHPAGLSGYAIEMMYQNFMSKDLVKSHKANADEVQKLKLKSIKQKLKKIDIISEIARNKSIVEHFNCQMILHDLLSNNDESNVILEATIDPIGYKKCLQSLKIDFDKGKNLFTPKIDNATFISLMFQIASIKDIYSLKQLDEFYNFLKEKNLLNSIQKCNSPRTCYNDFLSKSEFEKLVDEVFAKYDKEAILTDNGKSLLRKQLDSPRFRELNVSEKDLEGISFFVNPKNQDLSEYIEKDLFAESVYTRSGILYILDKERSPENRVAAELKLKLEINHLKNEFQKQINKWLKSLDWYDVAAFTDRKIGTMDTEQVMGTRDEYEDHSYQQYIKEALEIDRSVEVR